MKHLSVILMLLCCASTLIAQDGSNICNVKTAEVTKSDEGKFVHLDFGKKSFLGFQRFDEKYKPDEVTLQIKGLDITFREHWEVDGFNAWWDQQYLESAGKIDGMSLRISKFFLQEVLEDALKVKAYFQYLDSTNRATDGPWLTEELLIEKRRLVEVWFKVTSNEPCRPRAGGDS